MVVAATLVKVNKVSLSCIFHYVVRLRNLSLSVTKITAFTGRTLTGANASFSLIGAGIVAAPR